MNLYNFNNIGYGECYSVMASSVEEAIDAVIKRLEEIESTYTIEYFYTPSKNNSELIKQFTNDRLKIIKRLKDEPDDANGGDTNIFEINVLKAGEVLITEWA